MAEESPGGSSNTSEGSEKSRSFEDSRRSDGEDFEDKASFEDGGSETPRVRRSSRESKARTDSSTEDTIFDAEGMVQEMCYAKLHGVQIEGNYVWTDSSTTHAKLHGNGRMILESVENGPLIWPTIEENGVTRTMKYAELSATKKIQADCDLPPISFYKQERECKLYDKFDKVAHVKGESLHSYYLSLPSEWSKFVMDVKLVRDLLTANFDQLHAYLQLHEMHANEVRLLRERHQDPLALVANQQTPHHFNNHQSSYHNPLF
ncbi:hypothetical protein Tco_0707597 [Tanacetum coccineum]|uniref:Uncharacterized protein n=1 Tax=Tanacetum coccineum TaxID=301880 RepID=A0ABQ4YAU3_9ASTR